MCSNLNLQTSYCYYNQMFRIFENLENTIECFWLWKTTIAHCFDNKQPCVLSITISDLQFVSPVIDNAIPPKAFIWKNEKIDIYSCSFARFSDSFTTYPLEFDVRQALKNGTSNVCQIFIHSTIDMLINLLYFLSTYCIYITSFCYILVMSVHLCKTTKYF